MDLTPDMPNPHPDSVEIFALKELNIAKIPMPAGPKMIAIILALTKLVTSVTAVAPPMIALERRMRAKDIGIKWRTGRSDDTRTESCAKVQKLN